MAKPLFHGKAITIACTDRERSEDFYCKVLGAKPIAGEEGTCAWFELGALTITILPNAEEASPAEFPTHAMPILWLETTDLKAARAHLRRHKIPIDEFHDGEFLMARDPDGLPIEIWQVTP